LLLVVEGAQAGLTAAVAGAREDGASDCGGGAADRAGFALEAGAHEGDEVGKGAPELEGDGEQGPNGAVRVLRGEWRRSRRDVVPPGLPGQR
jgi:hypothetical protein